jgi:hypothetical protein
MTILFQRNCFLGFQHILFTGFQFNTFFLQGFNRIAAIALLFMNEEDAFWCLVYIVEQLMPPQYYSKQLVGAQVDQVITEPATLVV